MTRIIPGVEIQVITEIVPQQLNPSGVVAMIGATEKGDSLKPTHVGSFREFADKFGSKEKLTTDAGTKYYPIVKDVKQAFQNGVFEIVVVGIPSENITDQDCQNALDMLQSEPDVDIVMACATGLSSDPAVTPSVHSLIEAHCKTMEGYAKNRIGLGTVNENEAVTAICSRTTNLASNRFALIAPYGNLGAVAGLISRLNYYESPTFKSLSGISELEKNYSPSEQQLLLSAGIIPIEAQRGRGIIVVKGITTKKDQISVIRIADHSVRGVKSIADLFIGTLNSPSGRMALKGKITEFLMRMEREGSLVPSTDGKEPAYLLDVYSSELDFAQGIVRVDMAVRPVRAMDYIYATILVEA